MDILAIDDEQIILDAITRVCEAYDLTVDVVSDSAIAESRMLNNDYRLILCDLMMPDKDGFQLLDHLKANKIEVPVVFMTGFSTTENAVKALSKGAIDFIPKPFTEDEIISSIIRGMQIKKKLGQEGTRLCPEGYFRLGISSWMNKESDGTVSIGITKIFLESVEKLIAVDLLHADHQVVQGLTCAKLKCNKYTHNYIAPVSGRIVDYNTGITENVSLVKEDPYGKGWIYRVLPAAMEHEMAYLISCKKY